MINRWRLTAWGTAFSLLLIPLIAMQFTTEVVWTPFDFLFMGALIASVGIGLEAMLRISRNGFYRLGAGIALLTSFLLIWMNAAVGLIGPENNDANIMYPAIVLLGVIGAVISRFKPMGMTYTMAALAIMQMIVPTIALGAHMAPWDPKVAILSSFFAGLWLSSAWLFRKSITNPK